MVDIDIRPYAPSDLDACHEICLRTAHNGGDATDRHRDPRIVGEVWVAPYVHGFADFAFVAEDGVGVGGYIVGVPDTAAYDAWAETEWFAPLRGRYPLGMFEAGTADADCLALIHDPPRMPPEIIGEYPAHLHIDLLPRLQGRGAGRRLMATLFAALRSEGVGSIHLGCSPENTRAIAFYRHLGFTDLMGGFLWGRSTEPL